jgi:hypothetical protein
MRIRQQTYSHLIARCSSPKSIAALREARCRLLHDVEINHIDSPCI